jgi:hypothetical protein
MMEKTMVASLAAFLVGCAFELFSGRALRPWSRVHAGSPIRRKPGSPAQSSAPRAA